MNGTGASTRTVRVAITGKVQGVWFRAWTREEATRHGLSGWVRNRLDGSVEAQFHGPISDVHVMLSACRTGSPRARVENVVELPIEEPITEGFRQLPTR